MRILYLCADPGIPIFGRKGCSTHVRETAKVLHALGHEVRIVCTNVDGDPHDGPGLDTIHVAPFESRKLGFDLRRALVDRRIRRAAGRLAREWAFDAIYERYSLYSRVGLELERRYRVPRVLEVNAFLTNELSGRIRFRTAAKCIERRILANAPRVIVVSEPLRRQLHAIGVPNEHICKMPMAVDLDRFSPAIEGRSLRRELGLEGSFVIGYVGTLSDWHGLELLFDVAARMREATQRPFVFLIVGGDGHKLERLRGRIAERDLAEHIRPIGSVPHEEVPAYIRAMDAAIIPDTTYWSSPSKLFEYMASAVAIVTPKYPAIVEAVTHEQEALIFPRRDTAAMARECLRLLESPELAARLASAARVRAEHERSWVLNGRRILQLFEEIRDDRAMPQPATAADRYCSS